MKKQCGNCKHGVRTSNYVYAERIYCMKHNEPHSVVYVCDRFAKKGPKKFKNQF